MCPSLIFHNQSTQKELEVIELKKKIVELEEKLKEEIKRKKKKK